MLGRKAGRGQERRTWPSLPRVAPCLVSRARVALNFGPAPCARPESGLCQRLAALSLREPWFILGAGPGPSPQGRKKPGSLQGRLLTPDPMSPRTGVGCKSRCLRRGSFPSLADRHQHCLFTSSLSGAPSADLCSLGFGVTPSLCDKPSRESFYYLMFKYYLGNGLELPSALLRRPCPRQTPSGGLMGCPSPQCWRLLGRGQALGRRPVFWHEERCALFPGTCLSLAGDHHEAERPLCARRDRDWSPSALEGLVSVPGTPDSCVQLLRKP